MVFDKLKFWQKDPIEDLKTDFGTPDPMASQDPLASHDPLAQDSMMGQFPTQPQQPQDLMQQSLPQEHQSPFGTAHQQEYHEEPERDRDMELVLAKLDAIKAELDSVHQRVRTLERGGQRRTW